MRNWINLLINSKKCIKCSFRENEKKNYLNKKFNLNINIIFLIFKIKYKDMKKILWNKYLFQIFPSHQNPIKLIYHKIKI